jgi:hypothetical protein
VRNPNQRSTWLIHDGPVGVKCRGEPRVFGQPVPDGGGLVGGEVVTDQVHVEFGGYGFVDGGEEFLNSTARCWGCRAEITVPSVMSNAANRLPDTAPPEVADGHRAVRDRERSVAQPGAARKDRKARMRRWNYAPLRHDHRRQSAEIFVPL